MLEHSADGLLSMTPEQLRSLCCSRNSVKEVRKEKYESLHDSRSMCGARLTYTTIRLLAPQYGAESSSPPVYTVSCSTRSFLACPAVDYCGVPHTVVSCAKYFDLKLGFHHELGSGGVRDLFPLICIPHLQIGRADVSECPTLVPT